MMYSNYRFIIFRIWFHLNFQRVQLNEHRKRTSDQWSILAIVSTKKNNVYIDQKSQRIFFISQVKKVLDEMNYE